MKINSNCHDRLVIANVELIIQEPMLTPERQKEIYEMLNAFQWGRLEIDEAGNITIIPKN